MASVHKSSNSKYWYAYLRAPVETDPSTGKVLKWKQTKRSTGQTDRSKAERAALQLEEALREQAGAGSDRSNRLLGILRKATDIAVQGRLSEPMARQFLGEIFAESTGRELRFYTIQEWLEEWLSRKETKVLKSTLYLYRVAVKAFLAWLGPRSEDRLETMERDDFNRFIEQIHHDGRTAKTANQYKKALFGAFKQACQAGLLLANPVDGVVDLPEDDSVEREPFTSEEITALITAAGKDEEWKVAIILGAYTGLRLTNCTRMKWSDIDMEKGFIRITPVKQRRTKKRKKRLAIPIHSTLQAALSGLPGSDDPEAFLLPRLCEMSTGGSGGLDAEFRGIMKRASVDRKLVRSREKGHRRDVAKKSFHSLRHASNSMMADAGVSQELRREILGHTSDTMNAIYTHLSDGSLKRAVDTLPEL